MLFGFIRDRTPEQMRTNVSCALCSTVVCQSCSTVISESAKGGKNQQFACFRCFAQIIIDRRQAHHPGNQLYKRAA